MPGTFTTLRSFSESELLFDEQETKDILKFFFPPLQQQIDAATVTIELRNFAQGLLVEAIDATYALGYVEILLKAYFNPGASMKKALTKIGKKATAHWFKHATQHDLLHARISSRVRDQLTINFKSYLTLLLAGIARAAPSPSARNATAYVCYGNASGGDSLWG